MLELLKKNIDRELISFLTEEGQYLPQHPDTRILFSGIKDFVLRKGKKIRPMLFIISYKGYSKKRLSPKSVLRCSLAFELLHDFLLVHDDVIDSSDLRRGKPTLHRVYNRKLGLKSKDKIGSDLSIVAGDILFTMAIRSLLSIDEDRSRKEKALAAFLQATAFTGAGEFIDVTGGIRNTEDISEKDILLMYNLKTSKYTFECPLITGAILGGAGERECKKLAGLGSALGEAFQIQDDMLDMFSSRKAIGKPVLSDLDESKKTLLIRSTYDRLDNRQKKYLQKIMKKKKKSYNDLVRFRKLVKGSGAHRYCLDRIVLLTEDAFSVCRSLGMKLKEKQVLTRFIKDLAQKSEELKTRILDEKGL